MSSDPGPGPGSDPVLRLDGATKRFPAPSRRSLLAGAVPFGAGEPTGTLGLDDVTLEVHPGELVGVIGANGAGKSTLLRLAAGILEPTSGVVEVRGTPAPMIELGYSFHPELTGWENLPLATGLFGVDRDVAADIEEAIVDFSGLRDFLHLPIKHFSTGMVARLGFAVATHVPSSLLLVDEVLAVGDHTFQERCIDRIRDRARDGVAVVFVSHSLDLVGQVCDRAICLDHGRVVDAGPVVDVIGRYERRSLAPVIRAQGRPASISAVHLEESEIETGGFLTITCVVQVDSPGHDLRLGSELTEPGLPGAVNVDSVPPGCMSEVGSVALSTVAGPIPVTPGKLELSLSILQRGGDGYEMIDRVSVPFVIVGENAGAIRFAIDSSWSIEESSTSEPRPVRKRSTRLDRDDLVWCDGLTKSFPRRRSLGGGPAPGASVDPAPALDDVTFSIPEGAAVGLIGANGAGKSTLLRVLTGVTEPTSGSFGAPDGVVAILELGSGFHGDLTGRENLEFTWVIHGGDPAVLPTVTPAIAEFAGLTEALDLPVKHYSTGMGARLAIALALELHPAVLMIDEGLSVGDIEFRERVRLRLVDLIARGTTLLFASHDLYLVAAICSTVLHLDAGRLIDEGPATSVIANAGGAGWAGGTSAADGGITISAITVEPTSMEWKDPFDVEVVLEVVRPDPNAYLEFSIRETLTREERATPRTPEQVLMSTMCLQPIPDVAEALSTPGTKTIRGPGAGLPLLNSLDVVISVIDRFDGTVRAEQWRTVFFGAQGASNARLEVTWESAEPPDPRGSSEPIRHV